MDKLVARTNITPENHAAEQDESKRQTLLQLWSA